MENSPPHALPSSRMLREAPTLKVSPKKAQGLWNRLAFPVFFSAVLSMSQKAGWVGAAYGQHAEMMVMT
jgi:hypothetical protein